TSPTSMTIDPSTGLMSWTPTGGGEYDVNVSVSDGNGGEDTQEYTIEVVTYVSGTISTDTTWTLSGSPYIVTGGVVVMEGVVLTIEPGVEVKFNTDTAVQVDGTLIARGTADDKIIFTSCAEDWGFIYFSDSSVDASYDSDGNYIGGSILENCVIEYAGGADVDNNGAVRIYKAHPFINYTTIRNNLARGICVWDISSTLKITNNTISNNTAQYQYHGGGIYIYRSSGLDSSVIITNNIIKNNIARRRRGGIYNDSGAGYGLSFSVTITNNIINNNIAQDSGHGGGFYTSGGSVTIANNTINNNNAQDHGGGFYIASSFVTITNNIINNNIAQDSGGGFYIWGLVYNTISTIFNNSIIKNTAGNAPAFWFNS
ncbi:unnamed protein product, partial [marine sediment metagenome]